MPSVGETIVARPLLGLAAIFCPIGRDHLSGRAVAIEAKLPVDGRKAGQHFAVG